ncbi:alternative ribosome rescue aminoacyl-tRNA hydrolase ArfB [Pelagibacterium xiamenense]|uniref:alternative ribosome rescue aminoacyl-tRNA hydrolase ArfB n=1 Tax=Pelagibacterium xiamenense TaxID=2901140 RepID=UPI001E4A5417|nr:alternative ribosome rescue aminoacyl-tRNA hydrolase ArfB [Pelagibacterium xiamenense]MCD7060863.1 aminoacyl-tRNA hydrolase [Pelagibacterium xiamenense]
MSARLHITDALSLATGELSFSFVRAPGPGGQNVNKVASAAQLRFDLRGSPSLPEAVKSRAAKLAGTRLTTQGEIVITASSYRTQERNREDAVARLVALLRRAATPPKKRVPTRPSLSAKRKRTDAKTRRGAVKKLRSSKPQID